MSESGSPYQRYTVALVAAVAVHAAVLFGIIGSEPYTPPEFGIETGPQGIEVDLVAALPAEPPEAESATVPEPPVEAHLEPPEAEPVIPEPTPPPEPEPSPVVEPEIPAPVPEPLSTPEPVLTPRPAEPPPKREAPPRPKTTKLTRASGDGSSAIPGQDATTARAASGALSAQPGYLRNPHPAYPEEARRAGQHGMVLLRVKIDDRGRVASVSVARSSGHPLLDERAKSTVEKRWAFRPARQGREAVASEVTIPIRFTLDP